jgi:hypothetical protein
MRFTLNTGASKLALLLLAAVIGGASLHGQLTVQLGTLGTGNSFPFNGTSFRFQSAYAPVDLTIPAGALITEIRVFGATGGNSTYGNLRCRLAHTNIAVNSLTGTFDTNYQGAMTTCLGPVNYTPAVTPATGGNWYTYTFTTPFVHNGTDNIVVDWSYDSRAGTGYTISTSAPATEQPRSRVYASGGNWQTVTGTSAASQGNYGIQFVYLPPGNANILGNQSPAFTVVPQGATDQVVMDMAASVFGTNQNITSIKFTKTGNVLAAALSNVKLVRDNNNNGIVEATDTVLGSGTLTAGAITYTGTPLQAVTTAASVRLLLAVTYVGPLPYGTTLNFQIAAAADVTWSGGTDYSGYPMNSGTLVVEPPSKSQQLDPVQRRKLSIPDGL